MFNLTEKENLEIAKWNNQHKKVCAPNYTAIGGRLTYRFTPTGLGVIVSVKCNDCGEIKDITETNNW